MMIERDASGAVSIDGALAARVPAGESVLLRLGSGTHMPIWRRGTDGILEPDPDFVTLSVYDGRPLAFQSMTLRPLWYRRSRWTPERVARSLVRLGKAFDLWDAGQERLIDAIHRLGRAADPRLIEPVISKTPDGDVRTFQWRGQEVPDATEAELTLGDEIARSWRHVARLHRARNLMHLALACLIVPTLERPCPRLGTSRRIATGGVITWWRVVETPYYDRRPADGRREWQMFIEPEVV